MEDQARQDPVAAQVSRRSKTAKSAKAALVNQAIGMAHSHDAAGVRHDLLPSAAMECYDQNRIRACETVSQHVKGIAYAAD
jgi:hypothetical protein